MYITLSREDVIEAVACKYNVDERYVSADEDGMYYVVVPNDCELNILKKQEVE